MTDLIDKNIYEGLRTRAEEVLMTDDHRQALIFVQNMSYALSLDENKKLNNYPDLLNAYRELIDKMKFVCLSSLSEMEIVELFEKKLPLGLQNAYLNINRKVRGKLVAIPVFQERDRLRLQMREAILRNNETIGSMNITIHQKPVRPTLANWITKYNLVIGVKKADSIEINTFFVHDNDVQKLDGHNKDLLRKLILLFEYLKLSSQTPEGLEEQLVVKIGDAYKVLKSAKYEDIKIPAHYEKMIDEIMKQYALETPLREGEKMSIAGQEVLDAYRGKPEAQKKIAEEVLKFQEKDVKFLRSEFFSAVQKKNVSSAIALLRILAHKDDIGRFLQEDQKLKKFLSVVWEKKGGKALAEEFQKQPSLPKFVKMFLKYVLEERLGLSSSDAARAGAHIGNLCKKAGKPGYSQMAYFDAQTKEFRWLDS